MLYSYFFASRLIHTNVCTCVFKNSRFLATPSTTFSQSSLPPHKLNLIPPILSSPITKGINFPPAFALHPCTYTHNVCK